MSHLTNTVLQKQVLMRIRVRTTLLMIMMSLELMEMKAKTHYPTVRIMEPLEMKIQWLRKTKIFLIIDLSIRLIMALILLEHTNLAVLDLQMTWEPMVGIQVQADTLPHHMNQEEAKLAKPQV